MKLVRWLIFCLLCLTAVDSAFALSSKDGTLGSPTRFAVGVEDIDYYPFLNRAEQSDKPGLVIEILNLFARSANLEFDYVYLPIARFPNWYETADIDFRVPDNPFWSSQSEELIFSKGIVNLTSELVIMNNDDPVKISDIKRIGSLFGFTPSEVWQTRIQSGDIEVKYDPSLKVLVQMLNYGLLDGLDLNIAVVQHYAESLGYAPEQFIVIPETKGVPFQYFLSTIEHPQVIDQFNRFLVTHKHHIDELMRSYKLTP